MEKPKELHEMSLQELRKGQNGLIRRLEELQMRESHPRDFPTHMTGTATSKKEIEWFKTEILGYETEIKKRERPGRAK